MIKTYKLYILLILNINSTYFSEKVNNDESEEVITLWDYLKINIDYSESTTPTEGRPLILAKRLDVLFTKKQKIVNVYLKNKNENPNNTEYWKELEKEIDYMIPGNMFVLHMEIYNREKEENQNYGIRNFVNINKKMENLIEIQYKIDILKHKKRLLDNHSFEYKKITEIIIDLIESQLNIINNLNNEKEKDFLLYYFNEYNRDSSEDVILELNKKEEEIYCQLMEKETLEEKRYRNFSEIKWNIFSKYAKNKKYEGYFEKMEEELNYSISMDIHRSYEKIYEKKDKKEKSINKTIEKLMKIQYKIDILEYKRHLRRKLLLNDNYYLTPYREIENLIERFRYDQEDILKSLKNEKEKDFLFYYFNEYNTSNEDMFFELNKQEEKTYSDLIELKDREQKRRRVFSDTRKKIFTTYLDRQNDKYFFNKLQKSVDYNIASDIWIAHINIYSTERIYNKINKNIEKIVDLQYKIDILKHKKTLYEKETTEYRKINDLINKLRKNQNKIISNLKNEQEKDVVLYYFNEYNRDDSSDVLFALSEEEEEVYSELMN